MNMAFSSSQSFTSLSTFLFQGLLLRTLQDEWGLYCKLLEGFVLIHNPEDKLIWFCMLSLASKFFLKAIKMYGTGLNF